MTLSIPLSILLCTLAGPLLITAAVVLLWVRANRQRNQVLDERDTARRERHTAEAHIRDLSAQAEDLARAVVSPAFSFFREQGVTARLHFWGWDGAGPSADAGVQLVAVCPHVLRPAPENPPIRTELVCEVVRHPDGTAQILCRPGPHDATTAEEAVCLSFGCLRQHHPDLAVLLEQMGPGQIARRPSAEAPWVIADLPPEGDAPC